jgi:hypothetical protein
MLAVEVEFQQIQKQHVAEKRRLEAEIASLKMKVVSMATPEAPGATVVVPVLGDCSDNAQWKALFEADGVSTQEIAVQTDAATPSTRGYEMKDEVERCCSSRASSEASPPECSMNSERRGEGPAELQRACRRLQAVATAIKVLVDHQCWAFVNSRVVGPWECRSNSSNPCLALTSPPAGAAAMRASLQYCRTATQARAHVILPKGRRASASARRAATPGGGQCCVEKQRPAQQREQPKFAFPSG